MKLTGEMLEFYSVNAEDILYHSHTYLERLKRVTFKIFDKWDAINDICICSHFIYVLK